MYFPRNKALLSYRRMPLKQCKSTGCMSRVGASSAGLLSCRMPTPCSMSGGQCGCSPQAASHSYEGALESATASALREGNCREKFWGEKAHRRRGAPAQFWRGGLSSRTPLKKFANCSINFEFDNVRRTSNDPTLIYIRG